MDDPVSMFLFVAVIAMVLMGAVTKSVGGAFLGLAVVCFATGMFLAQSGGWGVAVGLIAMLGGFFCALLAFGLGINFARSNMSRLDTDGTRWDATQTLWGDGAKNSSSHWTPPAHQVGGGNQNKLGDGQ